MGAKFDLRLACLLSVPVLLLSWIPRLNPTRTRTARRIWQAYFLLIWTAIAFVYFVDFANYDYLGTRVDAGVVEHLTAPEIALKMVWESYPIVWMVLALLAVVAAYGFPAAGLPPPGSP